MSICSKERELLVLFDYLVGACEHIAGPLTAMTDKEVRTFIVCIRGHSAKGHFRLFAKHPATIDVTLVRDVASLLGVTARSCQR